jgi:hypothetical protein
MASIKPKVEFEPVEMKIGTDWYVRMTHPTGVAQINGFKSKAEARHWIAHESADWLKKFEGGRLA